VKAPKTPVGRRMLFVRGLKSLQPGVFVSAVAIRPGDDPDPEESCVSILIDLSQMRIFRALFCSRIDTMLLAGNNLSTKRWCVALTEFAHNFGPHAATSIQCALTVAMPVSV
jgi:hypothetical protein